jgi:transposase
MRKSIDTLSVLVVEALEQPPQSGDVYLFRGKSSNKVKALYWDRNGFALHYKRLERGRFKFPKSYSNDSFEISENQMSWLLAGLDFILMNQFSELDYSQYF